ncbi:MAG: hypothetical protein ACREYF_19120 [Gammaproteobacteria bacterium]
MIKEVKQRLKARLLRNGSSESYVKRLTRFLSTESDALIIGFAHRFATYKRATLLFADPERPARLLAIPDRPVNGVQIGPGQQVWCMLAKHQAQLCFSGHDGSPGPACRG